MLSRRTGKRPAMRRVSCFLNESSADFASFSTAALIAPRMNADPPNALHFSAVATSRRTDTLAVSSPICFGRPAFSLRPPKLGLRLFVSKQISVPFGSVMRKSRLSPSAAKSLDVRLDKSCASWPTWSICCSSAETSPATQIFSSIRRIGIGSANMPVVGFRIVCSSR